MGNGYASTWVACLAAHKLALGLPNGCASLTQVRKQHPSQCRSRAMHRKMHRKIAHPETEEQMSPHSKSATTDR